MYHQNIPIFFFCHVLKWGKSFVLDRQSLSHVPFVADNEACFLLWPHLPLFRNHIIIILVLLSGFDIYLLAEDGNIRNSYCYILSEMLVDTNVPWM